MLSLTIDLTNPHWEIRYPLIGTSLPTDHGYRLYSAISHKIPAAHEQTNWSMSTIGGKPNGQREILIDPSSRLRIRTSLDQVPIYLQLVQKLLKIE